jgi:nicotinamide-nucleotide amidase
VQAEIVTIGTELLLGEIVDTNSAWIAQRLTTIGLNLFYTTTVGDNLERIVDVLQSSLQRSDIVITTGGLGPTVDDITRDAAAAATGREVLYDEELFQEIARYFAKRHYTMTDNNRKQACLPAGAQVIHNPVGTAPAFLVEHDGHVIICLPGVPHEMRYLMENEVLPYLRQHFGLYGIIKSRTLHTCGIGESTVDSKIGDLMQLSNPTVGTRAHPGQTDVCITAKADSEQEADALIAGVEAELRERLGGFVFGADEQTIGDVVAEALAEKGLRLAVVETSTWGELAQRLSTASKGDRVLTGSLVLPNVESLIKLGVSSDLVKQHGFPSQEVADAAAEQVRQAYETAYGLAIIGPADPGAENAPPVYFSLALADRVMQGQPRQGRSGVVGRGWLVHLGMDLVRRHLLGLPAR